MILVPTWLVCGVWLVGMVLGLVWIVWRYGEKP